MSTRSLGFYVDRRLTIEGPFRAHGGIDAYRARANIETLEVTYRVDVIISGPQETSFCGTNVDSAMPDEEREEARALFALAELVQRPVRDFERPEPGALREVRVAVGPGPDSTLRVIGMWTLESIRKHPALRTYTINREGSTWIARPRS